LGGPEAVGSTVFNGVGRLSPGSDIVFAVKNERAQQQLALLKSTDDKEKNWIRVLFFGGKLPERRHFGGRRFERSLQFNRRRKFVWRLH